MELFVVFLDLHLLRLPVGSCGCPITGTVEGRVGRGFDQPDLAKDATAHGEVYVCV